MILLQVSAEFLSLQKLLNNLYDQSLPLCSDLIGIGRAIGGLGALVYISSKIFGSLARAEPIDFYALLRPFVLGIAIGIFPVVLDVLNGIMTPISTATASMVRTQNEDIMQLQKMKEAALAKTVVDEPFIVDQDLEKKLATAVDHLSPLNQVSYQIEKSFREWLKDALELVYQSASLIINTVRTMFLIILSILGPLAWGFAIWPGFEGNLVNWLGRYITVSLWLPIANIFGAIIAKIQVFMLQADITRIQKGTELSSQDLGYLIFLLIGIACYFFVPTAASWVVQSTGVGQATRQMQGGASMAAAGAGAAAGRAGGAVANVASNIASAPGAFTEGYRNTQV